jgi:hypothetical protein
MRIGGRVWTPGPLLRIKGCMAPKSVPWARREDWKDTGSPIGICARLCARDAEEWAETGETLKLDADPRGASGEVSTAMGDGERRQRHTSYCS